MKEKLAKDKGNTILYLMKAIPLSGSFPNQMKMLTYQSEGVSPLPNVDWTGSVLVLGASQLSKAFQKPEFQLVMANGGFGCEPHKIGRAVFGKSLSDGELARWDRGQFIGVASPELIAALIPAK